MPTLHGLLLAGLLLLVAAPASGRDLCLKEIGTDNVFVFKNFKRPTRPLSVVPLIGYMLRDGAAYPFHGSAVAGGNDALAVGIFVHALAPLGHDLSFLQVTSPGVNTGFAKGDTNGDSVPDTEFFWTGYNCALVEP